MTRRRRDAVYTREWIPVPWWRWLFTRWRYRLKPRRIKRH